MIKFMTLILPALFVLNSAYAYDRQVNRIVDRIDAELTRIETAMAAFESNAPTDQLPDEYFYFNSFWIRLSGDLTFKIPLISVRVAPQIGLVWTRKTPENYQPYQPICRN